MQRFYVIWAPSTLHAKLLLYMQHFYFTCTASTLLAEVLLYMSTLQVLMFLSFYFTSQYGIIKQAISRKLLAVERNGPQCGP